MGIKTQGSQMYCVDPDTDTILVVGCVTDIDGIDTTLDQLETTCLDSVARTYVGGLATPGSATFGINFDPADASHVRMHQLKVRGDVLNWAIGFSDGNRNSAGDLPQPRVDSHGDFVLPATRSWIAFQGFMNSYPFTFAINALVTSKVGIQISGEPAVTAKTP
jgi:hypothetical protein